MSQLEAVYFNETILNWVDVVHSEVSAMYGMKKIKIKPNDYGHDSYVRILSAILSNVSMVDIMASIQNQHDINKFVGLAHAAWVSNYLDWKNKASKELSDNPRKSINTFCRNDRATTRTENLNDTDLELYTDIIQIVFTVLTKKIIQAGMQNLSIA